MTLDCSMLLVEEGFRHDPIMVFARASALGFSCPIGSVYAKSRESAFELRFSEFRVDTEILFNIDVG
jgi:hypothetical protein